jgi:hypothetical protein
MDVMEYNDNNIRLCEVFPIQGYPSDWSSRHNIHLVLTQDHQPLNTQILFMSRYPLAI